jgi:23S rRNA pseudoU1915 N3-methylase RlmH
MKFLNKTFHPPLWLCLFVASIATYFLANQYEAQLKYRHDQLQLKLRDLETSSHQLKSISSTHAMSQVEINQSIRNTNNLLNVLSVLFKQKIHEMIFQTLKYENELITISGTTLSSETLADFVKQLTQVTHLDVMIKHVKQQAFARALQFEITLENFKENDETA